MARPWEQIRFVGGPGPVPSLLPGDCTSLRLPFAPVDWVNERYGDLSTTRSGDAQNSGGQVAMGNFTTKDGLPFFAN